MGKGDPGGENGRVFLKMAPEALEKELEATQERFFPPQKKLKSGIFRQPGELEDSQDCPRDGVGFWDALCRAWSWNVLRDI